MTNIEAVRAAHTMSIGYTNKLRKTAELITAGADTVILTPATLTDRSRDLRHLMINDLRPGLGHV